MARFVVIVSLLLFAACGPSEQEQAATSPPAPAPTAAPVEPPAAPVAPAVAPQGEADVARGSASYQTLCASCHGPRGGGDGPAGLALDPRPARHDDGAYMNALSNEHLFRVIKEGGPAVGKSPLMAPWGGALSDAQIRDVVAFVRSLAEPPYSGPKP
jgi:mono/diheme cytochrome c family protein